VSEVPGPDADGLPLFPPLPGGRTGRPVGARSMARLVAGIRTAVLTVVGDDLAAMVVFVEHEPVDGVAMRGSRRVVGGDALDEIADAPVEDVSVTEVTPELARVIGSYFLPTELRGVPAGLVAAEDFVRSLARPGQRGCLLVRTEDALGVVFLARGRVLLAYREDGPIGGFDQVAPLFGVAGATLWARLGPDDAAAEPDEPEPPPVRVAEPIRTAPPPDREPVHTEPPPDTRPVATPADPGPPPVVVSTPPDPVRVVTPPAIATEAPLDAALAAAREVLGVHAVRVESLLRRATPTPEGLREAAESLRARRVRLLSAATMELVADRVVAALDRSAAGR
jgi:hypothetical protein